MIFAALQRYMNALVQLNLQTRRILGAYHSGIIAAEEYLKLKSACQIRIWRLIWNIKYERLKKQNIHC